MSVYVIAEAGVNHNGSVETARSLVDVAVDAGVDAVKFQTFRPSALATPEAPKAQYQVEQTGSSSSQLEILQDFQLKPDDHHRLLEYCRKGGVDFLSTPFDLASARFLIDELDLPRIKIASGEITNGPLLLQIASSGKPVILSTGMSTLGEIEEALGVLAFGYLNPDSSPARSRFEEAYTSEEGQTILANNVNLLQCTTEYPAPFEEVNLRGMRTLEASFGFQIGLSDHTQGITVPIAAVALGATIIEKHFTLSRDMEGPDHAASLEPDELSEMVTAIRTVECSLGSPVKAPTESERDNRPTARKSLVAARNIEAGERWTSESLTALRPGTGISPMRYWDILGTQAKRAFEKGELLDESSLRGS